MRSLISVVLAEGWQASRSNTVLLLWSTTVTSTPEKVHNSAKLQSEMEIPKWEKWDLWKEHDQFPFGRTGMVHWWEHFWPGFEPWHQHHNSVGWVCYVCYVIHTWIRKVTQLSWGHLREPHITFYDELVKPYLTYHSVREDWQHLLYQTKQPHEGLYQRNTV